MAFRDRAAAAATTDSTPVEAEVETAPASEVATPATGALTLGGLAPSVDMATAIDGALSMANTGTSSLLFPVVKQNGGRDARGAFGPENGVPDDLKDVLPEGTRPFTVIFTGNFRYEYTAWKWPHNGAPEDADPEDAKSPAYSFALSPNALDDVRRARSAAEAIQFTKTAERSKFNFATAQAGHLTPSLRLLCFSPEAQCLFALSTPNTLDSIDHALAQIRKLMPSGGGAFQPLPVKVRVAQQSKKNGYEFWAADMEADVEGGPALQSYAEFIASAGTDEALVQNYTDWVGAADKPITDVVRGYLDNIAALRPARQRRG